MTLQEKWLLAVCGADLGSELTSNSLGQKSSWVYLNTSFSLKCINPQALICTVSWNQWKSSQTWVWIRQVFLTLLTWSLRNGNGRPEKLRPFLSLSTSSGLLGWWSQGQASFGKNVPLNQNSQQILCCCLFCDVHLIMVDSTQLVFVLEIWECYIKKLVQTSFKLSLLQSSNQQTD